MSSTGAYTSLANRIPAAILASPLHRLLSGKRLVLSFTGRRIGRRYATPVDYLHRGQELQITTDSSWCFNLGALDIDGTRTVDSMVKELAAGFGLRQ